LHLHLEGAILPETLLTLAHKNQVDLPYHTVEGLQSWYEFQDFNHFVNVYMGICSALKTPADFELITYDLGCTLAAQNTWYAEVSWGPTLHTQTYEGYLAILEAMTAGQRRAEAEFGIILRWIPDIPRHRDSAHGEMIARWVSTPESQARGVVGLGVAGVETDNPPGKFEWAAAIAAEAGLPCTPHAGEIEGPGSIWESLLLLKTKRIKHGIRAIEDPDLVRYLVENQVLLEVCPSSNLCLRVYENWADYPLAHLAAAGVAFTISSDDPPMFNTTLTDEYLHAVEDCGLTLEQLEGSVLAGFAHSYLPAQTREALIAKCRAEFSRLRTEYQV
jgi:adenosine deaminase